MYMKKRCERRVKTIWFHDVRPFQLFKVVLTCTHEHACNEMYAYAKRCMQMKKDVWKTFFLSFVLLTSCSNMNTRDQNLYIRAGRPYVWVLCDNDLCIYMYLYTYTIYIYMYICIYTCSYLRQALRENTLGTHVVMWTQKIRPFEFFQVVLTCTYVCVCECVCERVCVYI